MHHKAKAIATTAGCMLGAWPVCQIQLKDLGLLFFFFFALITIIKMYNHEFLAMCLCNMTEPLKPQLKANAAWSVSGTLTECALSSHET